MIKVKIIYSEKDTKFMTGTTWDKSKVEILQNFVAFSEYMNFKERVRFILFIEIY